MPREDYGKKDGSGRGLNECGRGRNKTNKCRNPTIRKRRTK